jgi:mannose-6-phosphate isomerase-like protein (cupin superfamily)
MEGQPSAAGKGMKRKALRFGTGFRVASQNRRCQAAEMVIKPGQAEGGPRNRHRDTDQWLIVVSGRGEAHIKGERYLLASGVLLLIEHGDQHEIRNTGRALLKTLNFHTPPAYTRTGNELPRALP